MILRIELLVFVKVALFFRNSCAQYPKVPCPDIFQYENSDGLNFGKLALDLGFGVTTTLELKLSQTTLSNPAVTEKIDLEIDINDVHNYMATEKAVPLKVHFQYPNVSPLVTAIRVNGATLCSGPRVPPEAAENLTVNDSENSLSSKAEDGPMQISSGSTIASTKITDEKTHLITTSTPSSSPLPQFFKHLRRRSNTPTTPTTKDSDYNDSKNIPSFLLSPTNSTTGSQSTTTLPPFLKLLRPRLNTREATTTKSRVNKDSEGSPFSDQESISVYETNPNSEQSTIATVPITTTISPQLPSFFNILRRRSSIEPSSKVSSSSSTSSTILPTMSKTVTTATTLGLATTTTSFTKNTLFKNLRRRSHTPTTLNAIDSTYNDSENKASPELSSTISTTAETTTSLFTTKLPRFFKVLRSQLNTPEITTIKSTVLHDAQNSTFSEQESSTTLSTTTTTTVGTTLEATETSLTTNTPPITTKSSSQLKNFFKKLPRNSNTLTSTTARMTEKLLSSELSCSTLSCTSPIVVSLSPTNPTISTTTRSPSELPRYLEVLYFGPNSIPADCIR